MTQINSDNSAVIARLEKQRDELAEALYELLATKNIHEQILALNKGIGVNTPIGKTINRCRNALANLDSEPVCFSDNNHWSIEPHREGWAIYRGRDSQNHGLNLGQLIEATEATVMKIEEALNSNPPAEQRGRE